MPQSLVVSNGNMLASFDENLQMRDFFYPFVGEENHSAFGKKHRVGIWIDGKFSWLDSLDWEMKVKYHQNTLVGNSTARNENLGVELIFEDFVYTTHDILFRKIKIKNLWDETRNFRIYFTHDFYIYGDKKEDTAIYEPDLNAVLHYRKKRYFLVNGHWANKSRNAPQPPLNPRGGVEGMAEFTTGKSNYGNKEGTWRDAEDGKLEQHPIEQGSVDSTVGFHRDIAGKNEETLFLWVACGQNYKDILKNNNRVLELGAEIIYEHSYDYWKSWSQKENFKGKFKKLPQSIVDLYHQSLLLTKSQIDNRGAIIASTDSDIMKFNKDTYSYMWPRDGALVAGILAENGYIEPAKKFLNFCKKIITKDGYVLHKFNADGSLGSSWHAKWKDGKVQLPIQEDESALLLVTLLKVYENSKSIEIVQELFNEMVLKVGRFLVDFIDLETGLPQESFDPWEEQKGVFSYTSSTVFAGLKAAEKLSHVTGHHEDEKIFKQSAEKMRKAIVKHLYCEKHKRFMKKVYQEGGKPKFDITVDASLAFVWEMGVLPADDPKIVNTMNAIKNHLTVKSEVGGLARYEGDFYHRNYDEGNQYSQDIPGNPWIITTLWMANWQIETATKKADLKAPLEILKWAESKASDSQILPEQIDPFTNAPLSVAPLTWSHATFVDTVKRYLEKQKSL